MAIQFDKEKNIFTLESKNTAYQIMIGDYGVLQHLYYGKRVGKCDMSYLVQMYDRGFSGQIPDAGNRREFSMDTLLQEYSTYGTGDYRTESLRIIDGNGGYGADLRYESHKIYKGKYSICGLPAMYAKEEEADTLEIKLKDFTTNVAVILYYGVFHELDIITRAVTVINEGTETIILEKVASACLEFYHKEFDMVHFHGKHAMERELERLPIRHGMQSIGSVRGTSSHQHNPFVILCSKNATETTGDCYAMSFVYSGNFLAEVEVDQIEQTRMVMGIHPTQFSYQLKQGEVFDAPEVVMSYSGEGFSKLSNTFHKAYRNHLCRGKYPIRHGMQSIGSVRGTSSHQHNPFVILCSKNATETTGDCYAMSFVYSGNFLAEVEVDQIEQTRMVMGIHPTQFSYQLKQGEVFDAPEVVMSYSGEGFSKLSNTFHKAYRNHLCRGKYKLSRRPILINNWEATYFQFDEEKLFQIAKEAKELGVEMFVMDDGWFGKREDDTSGLGDWFVNEKKIKGGLGKLVERINQMGMKFGIWFEPEAVSEDSELYRAHPDWCLAILNRKPNRSRYELILDMARADVREYLFQAMCEVLDSANIEYVKWDMNRNLSDVWSAYFPKDRQGEIYHRYVLGLYELLEKLIQRYPDILFEGCSGGGGRFDAGMLYYTPQIWCSDNTDAIERLSIQYGTSFAYPISTVGSHVSVCPNHQTGRNTPMYTRAVVAMAGSFGYELDVNQLCEKDKEEIRYQIEAYKKYQSLIHDGIYDRLSNPYENHTYTAWQFTSEDKSEVLVNYVLTKKHANEKVYYLYLRNLEEEAFYQDKENGKIYTGAALMYGGLPMPRNIQEYEAVQLYFERLEKSN